MKMQCSRKSYIDLQRFKFMRNFRKHFPSKTKVEAIFDLLNVHFVLQNYWDVY